MFEDLLGEDDMDEDKMGKEIMDSVLKELKEFFKKSFEAEHQGEPTTDPLGKVHMRTTGTDYSQQVNSPNPH